MTNKYKYFFVVIALLVVSCKKSNEKIPTIGQSINYIEGKVDNIIIHVGDIVYENVRFRVDKGICYHSYDFRDDKNNDHYRVIESFPIEDITSVGTYYAMGSSIKLNFNKPANHRKMASLNYKSVTDYGGYSQETLGVAFIHLKEEDVEAVERAFVNIVKVNRQKTASDYFESD